MFREASKRFNEVSQEREDEGFCYGDEGEEDFEMERDIEIIDNTGAY